MDTNEANRQREQLERYLSWAKLEGTMELPTQLCTLLSRPQVKRIAWLRKNATGRILEVGCNWGYVLAAVGGHAGCDSNSRLIELAQLLAREKFFQICDARKLVYPDESFGTVMLPEVLEHMTYQDAYDAISEAVRVARRRVLITMPEGNADTPDAINPKHVWLATSDAVSHMMAQVSMNLEHIHTPDIRLKDGFWLIRLNLRRSR